MILCLKDFIEVLLLIPLGDWFRGIGSSSKSNMPIKEMVKKTSFNHFTVNTFD